MNTDNPSPEADPMADITERDDPINLSNTIPESVPNGGDGPPAILASRRGRSAKAETAEPEVVVLPARADDEAVLDQYEELERAAVLDDDDDDEPSLKEEVSVIPIVNKLPKFARFRVNRETVFDMWGTSNESGLDRTVVAVTKEFAPVLEEEVELRRVRFYETATSDGVVRLVYCFLPDKDAKNPNTWLASKQVALETGFDEWITMRSNRKIDQYTYRRAAKDYGPPKFSGKSRGELIQFALRKPGLLVENDQHPFYRKAADLDDE